MKRHLLRAEEDALPAKESRRGETVAHGQIRAEKASSREGDLYLLAIFATFARELCLTAVDKNEIR